MATVALLLCWTTDTHAEWDKLMTADLETARKFCTDWGMASNQTDTLIISADRKIAIMNGGYFPAWRVQFANREGDGMTVAIVYSEVYWPCGPVTETDIPREHPAE